MKAFFSFRQTFLKLRMFKSSVYKCLAVNSLAIFRIGLAAASGSLSGRISRLPLLYCMLLAHKVLIRFNRRFYISFHLFVQVFPWFSVLFLLLSFVFSACCCAGPIPP
jgi:hypothetical protein